MKNNKSIKVNIQGRVQGVFFRVYTQKAAIKFGLNGYVKNMPDGSVEAVIQGPEEKVDQMIEWCWKGSPMSAVTNVAVLPADHEQSYTDFDITY